MPQSAVIARWIDWFWAFASPTAPGASFAETKLRLTSQVVDLNDVYDEDASGPACDYVSGFASGG